MEIPRSRRVPFARHRMTDDRRLMEIRGRDPEAKSPHINLVWMVRTEPVRIFFSFFPFYPFFRQIAKRARKLFFYFKNKPRQKKRARGSMRGIWCPARAGGRVLGGEDTLLIKTIDLSPGLRMHLEINTRGGGARTLQRIFPRSASSLMISIRLSIFDVYSRFIHLLFAKDRDFFLGREDKSDASK